MGPRNTLALLLVVACQAPPVGDTGFGSMPDVTTAPVGASTGGSSSSSSSGLGTGEASGSASGSGDTTAGPARDLGSMPDFGDGSPVGCKGKIDFLFVISRSANMQYRQEQLAVAFPDFIATIQSKFEDFDYHIMVVTGDDEWGNEMCTDLCPIVDCKVGDSCCSWYDPAWAGEQCCDLAYPCQDLDLVTQCDRTWGAGEVFPAGPSGEANKPCPIDGGRRYLVKGQSDLEQTFACIATVGASGYDLLGQALTAAMQSNINDPGGCNGGFLRKDALLMVTMISTNGDVKNKDSKGTPAEWAEAVVDAKRGDEKSVVMLNIGYFACDDSDRLCQVAKLFPFHHLESVLVDNYGPAFVKAANLVETACAGFVPPG